MDNELKLKFYKKMFLIRYFEERMEEIFKEGKLKGTMHGYKGQEAIAVGVLENVEIDKDWVTGTHRSHGHYLALSEDPYRLIAELMGKKTGLVFGIGGSQHFRYKNFFNNGITGGLIPIGVGIAHAMKIMNKDGIVVSFLGDGAMNEGYVMEAFNLAGVYKVPILFVLENNKYAMSTRTEKFLSGDFESRIRGFGIDYHYLEVYDVIEVYKLSKKLISELRLNKKPIFVEFKTHRFSGHSKSDKREYIPPEEDKYWKERDALANLEKELISILGEREISKIKGKIISKVDNAILKAENDPFPSPEEVLYGE